MLFVCLGDVRLSHRLLATEEQARRRPQRSARQGSTQSPETCLRRSGTFPHKGHSATCLDSGTLTGGVPRPQSGPFISQNRRGPADLSPHGVAAGTLWGITSPKSHPPLQRFAPGL